MRGLTLLVGGVALLVLVASVHVDQGTAAVGLGGFLDTLLGRAPADVSAVVLGSRLPRLIAGIVAGAGLAVAGNLLQTVTRNPLAAPDTLAVNAGAYFATVLAVVTGLRLGALPAGGVAFLGGLAAAAAVYLLAAGVGATPTRLLLAGVAVSLCLTSATSVLLLMFEQQASGMFLWGQGSLLQANNDRWLTMLPVVAVVGLVAVLLARTFDVVGTGDDTARAVGVPVGRVRLGGILLAVLTAAAAVTVCGPIGFVGLVAPHLVRLAGVHRHRWMVPITAVWGATLLVAADVLARALTALTTGDGTSIGSELPAGVVTALAGAPFFLWLARRERTGAGTASTAPSGVRRPRLPYGVAVAAGLALLVVAALGALKLGDVQVAWGDVLAALTGGQTEGSAVVESRMPRVLVAVIAGAGLAASGVVLQGVVRNPLAEPTLLGVTGGAGVGALLLLFAVPAAVTLLPLGAFLGAVAAFGLTYAVAWRKGMVPERLVLVGVGVSALTAAAVSYLVTVNHLQLSQALTWLSGSIYARGWDDLALVVWIPALLLPLAWVGARQLDVLALGDDPSRAVGLRLEPVRLALLALAVALASGAVAVVGTIGFVGLVAPHAARSMVSGRHRRLLVVSVLLGGLLVLVADTLGRTLLAPKQLPAGLIIALVGTPYFAYRLWRTKDRRV